MLPSLQAALIVELINFYTPFSRTLRIDIKKMIIYNCSIDADRSYSAPISANP